MDGTESQVLLLGGFVSVFFLISSFLALVLVLFFPFVLPCFFSLVCLSSSFFWSCFLLLALGIEPDDIPESEDVLEGLDGLDFPLFFLFFSSSLSTSLSTLLSTSLSTSEHMFLVFSFSPWSTSEQMLLMLWWG